MRERFATSESRALSPAFLFAGRAFVVALPGLAAGFVQAAERPADARLAAFFERESRDLMLDDLRLAQSINALYGPLPFDGLGGWPWISSTGSPAQSLVSLSKAMPFATTRDYDRYLKRLAAFPQHLHQITALMREGVRSRWMPPRAIMARVPSQFDAVTPAVVVFGRYVVDEYLSACRESLAASSLPGGERYYALAVQDATTTELDEGALPLSLLERRIDRWTTVQSRAPH